MPSEEEKRNGKRLAQSPLDLMKVKKVKPVEGTVAILDKPPVRKEITKLEVVMKQSAEASSKWNTIGTVVKREPGVWGRISPESVTKNILTELNLLKG